MKRLLFVGLIAVFISFFVNEDAFSQKKSSYRKSWEKVEKLVDEDKPRSALSKVEKILSIAQKEKNAVDIDEIALLVRGRRKRSRWDNATVERQRGRNGALDRLDNNSKTSTRNNQQQTDIIREKTPKNPISSDNDVLSAYYIKL